MPRERGVSLIRRGKHEGEKVWICEVPGCDWHHSDAEEIEEHMGAEHSLLCLSTDFLWLNAKGQDVVPEKCLCVTWREVEEEEPVEWMQVTNVILDPCMECVIREVGQDCVYGPRSAEQDAQLDAVLDKYPTDSKYGFCVGCGSSICSKCMGNKYFPDAIETAETSTGFQVKASHGYKYFVCHDCGDNRDRVQSSYIIRNWQKLLHVLNGSESWKMHTKMQLHKHASSAPGRYVYTLEHINSDFSGSKCGRCRACFNRGTFKQSCKNMGTHYDRGEFVYEFDASPDERFEGDVSEDAVSNPPSSKKQAEPSSSKQAVRVGAASKKQAEPSNSKKAAAAQGHSAGRSPGPNKADVDVAEIMKLCASHMRSSVEKIEDTWLQRVNTEHTLQRSYKSISKEEQARRMELEARLQELTNTINTVTADRNHLRADRDTQRQTEATLMERLKMAEAMAHTNEQAITAVVKELRGSLGAMQQAVKESTEHLLSSFRTLIDEKLGAMQSVTSQIEPVTEEPATEEPMTEEPVTEEPATEEPATEEPMTEEPATEEPATEEPATEEPMTEEPATEEPVTKAQPAQEVLPELSKKRKHEDGDAPGYMHRID